MHAADRTASAAAAGGDVLIRAEATKPGRVAAVTWRRAQQHQIAFLASHAAFRLTFALFPGLIGFLWLTRVFHTEGVLRRLLDLVATVMPSATQDPLRQQLLNP